MARSEHTGLAALREELAGLYQKRRTDGWSETDAGRVDTISAEIGRIAGEMEAAGSPAVDDDESPGLRQLSLFA